MMGRVPAGKNPPRQKPESINLREMRKLATQGQQQRTFQHRKK